MARFHGRFGRVYLGLADSSATAEPLPFIATWSLSAATEKINVTALGDTTVVNVAGLPDASGEFGGFMDDTATPTYQMALDGLPRRFYLYPTLNTPTLYFFGTVFVDASFNAGVSGAAEMSATWAAATSIIKKP